MNNPEKKAFDYYKDKGWEIDGDFTIDAIGCEDLRKNSQEYVSKCRMRVFEHIPESGKYMLDMASGPIQYPEYLEFSKNFAPFNERGCFVVVMDTDSNSFLIDLIPSKPEIAPDVR